MPNYRLQIFAKDRNDWVTLIGFGSNHSARIFLAVMKEDSAYVFEELRVIDCNDTVVIGA